MSKAPARKLPDDGARISISEIMRRLKLGKAAVYGLLVRGEIPAIRPGSKWIISRQAYERWERNIGRRDRTPGVVPDVAGVVAGKRAVGAAR